MDKFERVIEVPACYISREVANRLAVRINEIASELGNHDYVRTLRELAPHLNTTPDDAVAKYFGDPRMRAAFFQRKDRVTIISRQRNVQYVGRDVAYDEIPTDPRQIMVEVPGVAEKRLNINFTTDLWQALPPQKANRILIQATDHAWLEALHQEIHQELDSSKKMFRHFVYRFFRPLAFLGFLALSFLELKAFQLVRPTFTLITPLTGIASLMLFVSFVVNLYLAIVVGGGILTYLYPYFELQDRLSERRKDLRKWWVITVAAIYSGGIWALAQSLRALPW